MASLTDVCSRAVARCCGWFQRTKTLKDLEAAALREAQAILKKEEARKKAEERAKARALRDEQRRLKKEKRAKIRQAQELRQKFVDQEAVGVHGPFVVATSLILALVDR